MGLYNISSAPDKKGKRDNLEIIAHNSPIKHML